MSEVCYRAASFGGKCLNEEELAVVTELCERMTKDVTEGGNRIRTQAELNDIIAFWWKLQDYRTQWLQKTGRADTDAVVLTVEEVRKVRREWIYYEARHEVEPQQKEQRNLSSIYSAMLNNKIGWKLAADAILEHRSPLTHSSRSQVFL